MVESDPGGPRATTAAAGVAVLVLKLADGGFPSFSARRQHEPGATFESQIKARAEADSRRVLWHSVPVPRARPCKRRARTRPFGGGRRRVRNGTGPDVDGASSAPANRRAGVQSDAKDLGVAESRLSDESGVRERAQAPAGESTFKEPAIWGGVEAQATPPPPPLAKAEQEKASAAPAPPPPAAARGHLDPEAALSIATLALQVGDLLGARLALQDLPTLPADSLTARAAVLALTLAERSQDLADCRAARERADALVEAVPSGALADTLRVRRAALPCPH
jgi:hypothetical protein